MRIDRRFAPVAAAPFDGISFRFAASELKTTDGERVSEVSKVEAPADWSQVAVDILAQKYFRKAGVPARLKRVEEPTVPSWLWRSVPDEAALAQLPEEARVIGHVVLQYGAAVLEPLGPLSPASGGVASLLGEDRGAAVRIPSTT